MESVLGDGDLIKLVILNVPNFIGFVIALVIAYRQNQELIALLRECNDRRDGEGA